MPNFFENQESIRHLKKKLVKIYILEFIRACCCLLFMGIEMRSLSLPTTLFMD